MSRAMPSFRYEIIVADDGSTDSTFVVDNLVIDSMSHCRYVERRENVGRSAIRNFLVREAHYDWLLFIDSDARIVCSDYLSRYLSIPAGYGVVNGGVRVCEPLFSKRSSLRYLYEKHAMPSHSVEKRKSRPYNSFRTTNFLVRREVALAHPFDERLRRYGYEDVLFGKAMRESGIAILHIDAPVGMGSFEDNAAFVQKTEEGLQTLHAFRRELVGYSSMLAVVEKLRRWRLLPLVLRFHRLFGSMERRVLLSSHPCLLVFRLYKLGYFLSLG